MLARLFKNSNNPLDGHLPPDAGRQRGLMDPVSLGKRRMGQTTSRYPAPEALTQLKTHRRYEGAHTTRSISDTHAMTDGLICVIGRTDGSMVAESIASPYQSPEHAATPTASSGDPA